MTNTLLDCVGCDGRYAHPFYIGRSRAFKGAGSDGYLPALCSDCPLKQEPKPSLILNDKRIATILKTIDQLRAENVYLKNKLNEHLDKSKRTTQRDESQYKGLAIE